MSKHYTISSAIDYLKNKTGRMYSHSHMRYLCQTKALEGYKISDRLWIIVGDSLESFKPDKPGRKANN
jgi:hypothetical protein